MFKIGNFLSFNNDRELSLELSKPVKELKEDNTFITARYELLKSAVIYGANAGGKSNFLKAMDTMRWLIINSSKNLQAKESLRLIPFKLSTDTLNEPCRFEIIILIDDIKYRYGFEADKKEIKSEWLFMAKKIKEDPLFIREKDEIQVFSRFKEGKGLEERTRDNALFLSVCAQFNGAISEKILEWFFNFNVISGLQDKHYLNYSANMFLNNDNERSKILDLVKKADLGISNINVETSKLTEDKLPANMPDDLKKTLLGKDVMSILTFHKLADKNGANVGSVAFDFENEESEGTKKYFRLSGPIIDTLINGKILVIDELDARLHPILIREIVKLFNSKITNPSNAQLIFATHDTNLLNLNIFRRDQIWFAEKDNSDATDLYSLSEYRLPKGNVRNDASFEKDYIQGRYGAIPFTGDFESLWCK